MITAFWTRPFRRKGRMVRTKRDRSECGVTGPEVASESPDRAFVLAPGCRGIIGCAPLASIDAAQQVCLETDRGERHEDHGLKRQAPGGRRCPHEVGEECARVKAALGGQLEAQ